MKPYDFRNYLKKTGLNYDKKIKEKNSLFNLNFIQKILDTINISLLVFILIFSFISYNNQREWSKSYAIISKIREKNNNLIDYISKTEEYYINQLETLDSFTKTTPKDLIYLDAIKTNKDNLFRDQIKYVLQGLKDSRYQIGY